MVVVDSSCLCESVAPITMAPIEIRYILPCVGPAAADAGKGSTIGKPRGGVNDIFPLLEWKSSRDFNASMQCWCRVGGSSIWETCLNYSQHNESLKCERLKAQKIRRRPESCHGFHPEVSLITLPVLFPPQTCHKNFITAKEFTCEKTTPFRRIREASTGRLLAPHSQPSEPSPSGLIACSLAHDILQKPPSYLFCHRRAIILLPAIAHEVALIILVYFYLQEFYAKPKW